MLKNEAPKMSALQIETIINKIVPLIAAPVDHEFFRAILQIKAEESSSGEFALFAKKLLDN